MEEEKYEEKENGRRRREKRKAKKTSRREVPIRPNFDINLLESMSEITCIIIFIILFFYSCVSDSGRIYTY
jgi:hypothetical protein